MPVSSAPSAAAVAPQKIRCHRCAQFVGEAAEPMEFVGVVKSRDLCEAMAKPRAIWLCKCGWFNIYRPLSPVSPLAQPAAP